jgi:hypothetical protein
MLYRLLIWPERRPGVLIAAIGLCFAVAYGASLVLLPKRDGRIVIGDAVHYYVHLRSAVFDGDVSFQNEYLRLYDLEPSDRGDFDWIFQPLPTGHVRNLMPVGPALVWAPLYLLTTGVLWALGALGLAPAPDGYGRLLQATAGFSGIAAAVAGAWYSYLAASQLFQARVAIWATLGFWLASSALYYSVISPTYSHAPSMLATAMLAWWWLRTAGRDHIGRYVQLGALVGFASLIRWQDATLLLVPALDSVIAAWTMTASAGERVWRVAVRTLAACAAAAIVFTPQMIVWRQIYGSALVLPQGEGFMRWTEPALAQVLLSDWHGLFTWTPIAVLAVAGLWPLLRSDRRTGAVIVSVIISSWYVNASVADWWAGEAFGSRRFLSCFPFFVLGLAAFLRRFEGRLHVLAATIAALVVLNGLLLFQYQLFLKGWRDIAPYPRGWYGLWAARFVVPFRAAARLLGI